MIYPRLFLFFLLSGAFAIVFRERMEMEAVGGNCFVPIQVRKPQFCTAGVQEKLELCPCPNEMSAPPPLSPPLSCLPCPSPKPPSTCLPCPILPRQSTFSTSAPCSCPAPPPCSNHFTCEPCPPPEPCPPTTSSASPPATPCFCPQCTPPRPCTTLPTLGSSTSQSPSTSTGSSSPSSQPELAFSSLDPCQCPTPSTCETSYFAVFVLTLVALCLCVCVLLLLAAKHFKICIKWRKQVPRSIHVPRCHAPFANASELLPFRPTRPPPPPPTQSCFTGAVLAPPSAISPLWSNLHHPPNDAAARIRETFYLDAESNFSDFSDVNLAVEVEVNAEVHPEPEAGEANTEIQPEPESVEAENQSGQEEEEEEVFGWMESICQIN